MTLYLVRWPDLSCTLVTACDEDHLIYLLDEVGNPVGCRWMEYDGPLFIDFHLPVQITIDWPEQAGRPLSPEDIQIEELTLLAQREDIQAEVGGGDTAGEMLETIMKFAFPATAKMYYSASEEVLEESQLQDALRADLTLLAESSWRRAQVEQTARDDSVVKLAVEMDAPMELVKYWKAMPRAMIVQRKTQRPVQFELTEPTRFAVSAWIKKANLKAENYLFPSRQVKSPHVSTRQYARIVHRWVAAIGLDSTVYGTHSIRRTKATLIYKRTKDLRAVQLLLGHTKIESTVRYLGIEVDDALEISEQTEI